jgi:hypothetical protein
MTLLLRTGIPGHLHGRLGIVDALPGGAIRAVVLSTVCAISGPTQGAIIPTKYVAPAVPRVVFSSSTRCLIMTTPAQQAGVMVRAAAGERVGKTHPAAVHARQDRIAELPRLRARVGQLQLAGDQRLRVRRPQTPY